MSTLVMKNESVEPSAIRAWAEKRTIYVELTDGRIIGFPTNRFKLLASAFILDFFKISACFKLPDVASIATPLGIKKFFA